MKQFLFLCIHTVFNLLITWYCIYNVCKYIHSQMDSEMSRTIGYMIQIVLSVMIIVYEFRIQERMVEAFIWKNR